MSSLISKNLQVGSDPTATNNFTIFQPATPDGTLRIGNGNTGITSSLLTLTSAGNFGVGTSSPAQKIDVTGNAAVSGQIMAGTTTVYGDGTIGTPRLQWNAKAGTYVGAISIADTSSPLDHWVLRNTNGNIAALGTNGTSLIISTANAERMRLDSSGNLGLGVTPSAWGISGNLEIGGSNIITSKGNGIYLAANSYFNSGFKYSSSTFASQYYQVNGEHKWFTAPSGTAGNAISFTQAMTLDASGNLLVGTTSTGTFAQSNGSMLLSTGRLLVTNTNDAPINGARLGSDGSLCQWFRGVALVGSISVNSSATAYNTSSDYRLKNITGPITNSGAYIDSLNPVEGTWKADGSTFVGLIAHEVQEASRTQVATGVKDGEQMQGMDYSSAEIIANMLAELKSLRARVAQLEAK